jgi:uncharacterized protein YkwD
VHYPVFNLEENHGMRNYSNRRRSFRGSSSDFDFDNSRQIENLESGSEDDEFLIKPKKANSAPSLSQKRDNVSWESMEDEDQIDEGENNASWEGYNDRESALNLSLGNVKLAISPKIIVGISAAVMVLSVIGMIIVLSTRTATTFYSSKPVATLKGNPSNSDHYSIKTGIVIVSSSTTASKTPISTPIVISPTATPDAQITKNALAQINQYRQQHSCAPVSLSETLTSIAQYHTEDMAYNNYLEHISPTRETLEDRLNAGKYQYTAAGENIGGGYTDGKNLIDEYYNQEQGKSVNRDNILNCKYKEVGIGYATQKETYYTTYWTILFGAPKNPK